MSLFLLMFYLLVFFNEAAPTGTYPSRPTLALPDALPISLARPRRERPARRDPGEPHRPLLLPAQQRRRRLPAAAPAGGTRASRRAGTAPRGRCRDRKSTRLNSSH